MNTFKFVFSSKEKMESMDIFLLDLDDDTLNNTNSSIVGDDDENPATSFLLEVGAVTGLAITAALCSISSWRLASHFIGFTIYREPDPYQQRPLAEGMTMRRMFHLLLWCVYGNNFSFLKL